MPPDRSCGRLPPNPPRWATSRSSAARCRRSALPAPRARSASSTLAAAVSHGNSAGSWNMNAVRPPTDTCPAVGWSSPATSDSRVLLPQPDAPIRQVNSPGAISSDTWSSARTAAPPLPYTFDTPSSRTDACAWVTVTLMRIYLPARSGTDLCFTGCCQRRVERRQVENAGQAGRLEQSQRGGLLCVGGKRCRVRVIGKRDLLERRREDAGLERLAGQGSQFRVDIRLGGGGVALDEVVGLDLCLQQVGDDGGVRGEEALRHDHHRGNARLAEQHVAAVADHLDVIRRRLGTAGDLAGLELEAGGRVGGRRLDVYVPATGRCGLQPVLLQPVAQCHVLGVAQRRCRERLALELGRAGDARLDDDRRDR